MMYQKGIESNKTASRALLLTILILQITLNSFGQNVNIRTEAQPNSLKLGEPINYSISIEFNPQEYKVILPQLPETIDGFEELSTQKADTQEKQNLVYMQVQKQYAHYDSGRWTIPAFELKVVPLNGTSAFTKYSDSIQIDINNIGAQQLKPIDEIIEAEKPLFEKLKPWLIGLISLLLLFFILRALRNYWKKRKNAKPKKSKKQLRPWEQAHVDIDVLQKKELWLQEKEKEHHTELTTIVRHYIESAFGIDCFEKTSQEIISAVKKNLQKRKYKNRSEELNKIRTLFTLADIVKFAKGRPTPEDHERSMEEARSFVDSTKYIFIEEEQQQALQNG